MSAMIDGAVTKRSKQRQQQRRMKRNVLQNLMVLKGWVPVQLNAQYGIYHHGANRLVLRAWHVPVVPQTAFPLPRNSPWASTPPPQGHWRFQGIELTAPFNGTECAWTDIQLRWVYALRSAAIGKGWM